MAFRVLLADDHAIIRDGLRRLLEDDHDEFEVVGESQDGISTVRMARELGPDIVLWDVTRPDLNGVEATRQIIAQTPRTRVIALSVHNDRQTVSEMLKAGAVGYLLKDCAYQELARAIRVVMQSQAYLSPEVAGEVIQQYVNRDGPASRSSAYAELTPREREVLAQVARGLSNSEIAEELVIEESTVKTHVKRILMKLRLRDRVQAVIFAYESGLTRAGSGSLG
jgi:DNA-binding NarL/FixJ family response regulator